MQSWIVLALVALGCGSHRPAHADEPLTNVEPAVDAAVISVDAVPCPHHCMDTCCRGDEVCSHGNGHDGTFAKCLRPH